MDRRTLLALTLAFAVPPGLASAAEEKKKAGGATYIQINTLTGTTNRSGGRRGVLTVDCGLDVPDEPWEHESRARVARDPDVVTAGA